MDKDIIKQALKEMLQDGTIDLKLIQKQEGFATSFWVVLSVENITLASEAVTIK